MCVEPLCDFSLNAIECPTADEENVSCVHLYVFLLRVLSPTLWRHVHHGAFEEFEQPLLHTFSTDVTCDGWVVAFACDLVNLVDEDDASLRSLHVVVSHLQQS